MKNSALKKKIKIVFIDIMIIIMLLGMKLFADKIYFRFSSDLSQEEFYEYFNKIKGDSIERNYSVATGKLAYPLIKKLCDKICEKFTNTKINVYEIKNVNLS